MSRVLLLQLDGKLPNIALMRIAAYHRHRGDTPEVRHAANVHAVEPRLDDPEWSCVYGSLIFERTKPLAERVKRIYPRAILGGTGWDIKRTLEQVGVAVRYQDYSVYPAERRSIGFTQRGCRLKCGFCVVPVKEGDVRQEQTIAELWRGEGHARELLILDNDFFGQQAWRQRIEEIGAGGFKVSFNQGINARMLTDETAKALASIDYRDDSMKERRLYTAWDNRKDEARLFAGLDALVKHGVLPRHLMVYMLIGYWKGETDEDLLHRQRRLREFGALPYPMPYTRTKHLVGFQRWVVGGYDRRGTPWDAWVAADYQPRNLGLPNPAQTALDTSSSEPVDSDT